MVKVNLFVINWTHILGTFDGRLTGITKGRLGLFLRGMYDVFPSSAPSSLLVECVREYQSLFEKNSIPEQNDQVAFVKHSSNVWLTSYRTSFEIRSMPTLRKEATKTN